jgi:tetratricopeptide (TPR) repeat protein
MLGLALQFAALPASARSHEAWWQAASAEERAEVTRVITDLAHDTGLTEAAVAAVFAKVDVPLYQGVGARIGVGTQWTEAAAYARKLLHEQEVPGVDAALAAFDAGQFGQLLVLLDDLAPVDGRPRRLPDPQWGVIVQVRMLVLTFTGNVDGAIAMLQQARRSRTDADRPVRYFLASLESGTWYNKGGRDGNLRAAEMLRDEVLPLAPRDTAPDDWAATQMSVCSTYGALARIEAGTDHAERAIAACEAALEVFRREDQPDRWAQTQLLLALALEASQEDGAAARAIDHYRLAYEVFGPDTGNSAYIRNRIEALEAR